ncbi:MAG: HoxN/HupN/NixA family nickel/cobalt transporter [Gammaproteobacteria bacterium]|nr:HoxN/HupN/NixA family nickel/cobalt transporter [Gammaproteobacteria bacterium]
MEMREVGGFRLPEAVGYGVAIVALHALGGWIVLGHVSGHPAYLGFAMAAYLLGLRHAFDADHIAAIDDTIRYRMRAGDRPLGVGFFFSLGHSTIVLAITLVTMIAAARLAPALPVLRALGGLIGTAISGAFLVAIGLLNLGTLRERFIARRCGSLDPSATGDGVAPRGFIARVLGTRLRRSLRHSWQMFPIGMLFGLGFDTASEIALLAAAAGATASGASGAMVLALPVLFAAGMSALDTADGMLMTVIYGWAATDARRRHTYDLIVTGLSVAVALLIGSIEWLQVLGQVLPGRSVWMRRLDGIDLQTAGYGVVAAFAAIWLLSLARSRLRAEPRLRAPPADRYPVRRAAANDGGADAP